MKILREIGIVLLIILKWTLKLVLGAFLVALEIVKILLMMCGMVLRIFLIFARAGTA